MLQVQLAFAVQALHVEPEAAGQEIQAVTAVAAVVVKYVLAGQLVHAAEPVVDLYVPLTQAVHVPPFGPVYPTAHCAFARARSRRSGRTCKCRGMCWIIVYCLYMN